MMMSMALAHGDNGSNKSDTHHNRLSCKSQHTNAAEHVHGCEVCKTYAIQRIRCTVLVRCAVSQTHLFCTVMNRDARSVVSAFWASRLHSSQSVAGVDYPHSTRHHAHMQWYPTPLCGDGSQTVYRLFSARVCGHLNEYIFWSRPFQNLKLAWKEASRCVHHFSL